MTYIEITSVQGLSLIHCWASACCYDQLHTCNVIGTARTTLSKCAIKKIIAQLLYETFV